MCIWRIEDSEDGPRDKAGLPNEPIMMCETDHIGDVADLQVKRKKGRQKFLKYFTILKRPLKFFCVLVLG